MAGLPSNQFPQIPAYTGEMLYVALSHVLDYIDTHGDYPPGMVENMRAVLAMYAQQRTAALKSRGITEKSIEQATAETAENLAKWLDEKAHRTEQAESHFDEWTRELSSDDQD
ncbi:Uncharacterised protein [Mycobacteroides abscessus subsp. massiliense]|nr:hypothetical protein [Mycobacteroides abscessus]SKM18491.1 Uncharacterised protein [Mycobacteroides abscessus subsp. massiliense]MDM2426895.1 hypothetical protein [Mycobacteroides abscessus]MDM2431775.1 hypothetical protein [Mycobacteroides abscessus]MDM2436612.1 hypothetical protein [Mycobacteroides abscessus]